MGKQYFISCSRVLIVLMAWVAWSGVNARAQGQAAAMQPSYSVVKTVNQVFVAHERPPIFKLISTNIDDRLLYIGDRVRIGPESELTILTVDGKSAFRFYEKTEFDIVPNKAPGATAPTMRLLNGFLYFFHRGKPGLLEILGKGGSAAVRGTEFAMRVAEDGTTVVTVIDGLVDLGNEISTVGVASGQEGVAEPGKAPVVRPAINAINVIQWTLYYPGILDPDEIPLTEEERGALGSSLEAYRAGDLLRALSEYPAGRDPKSDAERIYRAGLLLALGQVERAQALIAQIPATQHGEFNSNARLAGAIQRMIAAVKSTPFETNIAPELGSEWLAQSYELQAHRHLEEALRAAKSAVEKSPRFGFAWARLAELEFSFGRIDAAAKAVAKALELSPRNAQALALNGFLFAARNKMDSATRAFDEAIAVDGRLGNAWLGRGLTRIRKGDRDSGLQDLVTAAAMEPQRAFLRSYLGKGWDEAGEKKLAEHELELAEQLDPGDPTAWLYAALLKQQNNRINEAVHDLEHAQELGGNRGVYRSRFMLDEDRAVRSANLANIYRDAGMTDWSIREAGRAVSADYANYSAHLFLANSYDQLRDPNRITLRYETPAESEYLIANLLAPVAAGTLSHSVSQGEYSRLFEGNRFGVASTTEYLSRGAWYENGAQFGIIDNTAYSVEGIYRFDPGQRVNNDFEERDVRVQVKEQLTYKDSIFVRAIDLESNGGDRLQYYDQRAANPGLRTRERQEPILTIGYHREWSPSSHTILIASRLDDTFWVENPQQGFFFTIPKTNQFAFVEPMAARQTYRSRLEIYSGEAQHIWEGASQTITLGGRFQAGDFNTRSSQSEIGPQSALGSAYILNSGGYDLEFKTPFERMSFYGYDSWQIQDTVQLTGGITYDRIVHPENFRDSPISDTVRTSDQVSPKAGFAWTPLEGTVVRGAYTRSLSGASIDQSLTIEPSQVAGINQSFRSLIPESIVGSDIAAKFETFGLSLQHKFKTDTYIGIGGDLFYSENRRSLGILMLEGISNQAVPAAMRENLDYRERALTVTVDQLISHEWAIGVRYRLSNSRLDAFYPDVATDAVLRGGFEIQPSRHSTLHQLDLHANYNLRCGFFAQADALWTSQSNAGYPVDLAGDSFWQVNVIAGYRFLQRRAEAAIGLLNINGEDYRLNPLTPYLELPRERTIIARIRLNF